MNSGLSQCAETLQQILSDRTGPAASDGATVKTDNGNHFRSRSGQKTLIGNKNIMANERNFLNFDTRLFRQTHHGIARDAFQDTGFRRRCFQDSVLHNKDVVARTFGDFTFVIQHQRFDRSGIRAFDLGEDGVVAVDGRANPPTMSHEADGADCTIRLSADNLGKLIDGALNPMMAYTLGKLKIDGSMGVAMKVASLLEE